MNLVDDSRSNKNSNTVASDTVNDALSALSDAAAAASAAALTAASSGEGSEQLGRERSSSETQRAAEQARMGGHAPSTGKSAASTSPSEVPAAAAPFSMADSTPQQVAPENSASKTGKQEQANGGTGHDRHAMDIHSTHASHSVGPDSAASTSGTAKTTNANNGSSASDVLQPSSGRRESMESSRTSGSLKRPFSRVDELLEAAASPSSHSPAPAASSSSSSKPSKVKKSSSSKDIHSLSSSVSSASKDNRDNTTHNSTSTSTSGPSNSSASALPNANQSDHSSKPTVVSATRKSAYQGPKISMACYSCRSSKTRCSGTQPCNRCELKRMDCAYPLRDGRTANRNSLQALSAVSSTQSVTPPVPGLHNGYEPGAMERFNQAYALKVGNPHRSLKTSPGASHTTPSVFQRHSPPSHLSRSTFSSSISHHDIPSSSSSIYQFGYPHPGSSQSQKQRTSPYAGDSDDANRKRPSTGGSTTSRTHMSLPLNGASGNGKSSRSPPDEDRAPTRLSSSYPHFHHHQQQHQNGQYGHDHFTGDARPATAGASHYTRPVQIKQEEEGRSKRDRSHSFPYPVPSNFKDYVLPLPSLRNTPLASPGIGAAQDRSMEENNHEPERFLEGSSTMTESNALQLKEHRRAVNAHPEASAFSEAEPTYDNNKKSPRSAQQQGTGLPYPSSTAYLPFSIQQHRYSPLFSAKGALYAQQHHMRGEDAYHAHAHAAVTTVKREAETSPRIDELPAVPSAAATPPFESHSTARTEEETYNSEVDRSRASPPSTAATSLHSSIYGDANKADTPYTSTPNDSASTGPSIVGPAFVHSNNNLLPPIMGGTKGALPDTLLPWKTLLEQAGIPDLESLKSEIPFEAVKRYVDCLAESWPNVLPTFTKRFQLRYAIEDAITRAYRDAPPKIPEY